MNGFIAKTAIVAMLSLQLLACASPVAQAEKTVSISSDLEGRLLDAGFRREEVRRVALWPDLQSQSVVKRETPHFLTKELMSFEIEPLNNVLIENGSPEPIGLLVVVGNNNVWVSSAEGKQTTPVKVDSKQGVIILKAAGLK